MRANQSINQSINHTQSLTSPDDVDALGRFEGLDAFQLFNRLHIEGGCRFMVA